MIVPAPNTQARRVTAFVAAGLEIVIKAMAANQVSLRAIDEHPADFVLLDGRTPGGGVPFDWDIVGDLVTTHTILLAGGLHPDNVAAAVRRMRPWIVEVAPGLKDPDAIVRLVAEARSTVERSIEDS